MEDKEKQLKAPVWAVVGYVVGSLSISVSGFMLSQSLGFLLFGIFMMIAAFIAFMESNFS